MPMTSEQLEEQQRGLTVLHARYDGVFEPFGRKAEQPRIGQSARDYRLQNLRVAQRFLPRDDPWSGVSLDGVSNEALAEIERQILRSASKAATRPDDLAHTPAAKPDTVSPNMKMVTMKVNGQEVNRFYGQQFCKSMGRAGRRVISFLTNHGYVDASGRGLR